MRRREEECDRENDRLQVDRRDTTLYTGYTLYDTLCAMYTIHCVHYVQYTVYNVYNTLYTQYATRTLYTLYTVYRVYNDNIVETETYNFQHAAIRLVPAIGRVPSSKLHQDLILLSLNLSKILFLTDH